MNSELFYEVLSYRRILFRILSAMHAVSPRPLFLIAKCTYETREILFRPRALRSRDEPADSGRTYADPRVRPPPVPHGGRIVPAAAAAAAGGLVEGRERACP